MHTSTLFYSLLAMAATSQCFKFTGPNTSTSLHLSKEITITWSQSNLSEQRIRPTCHLEWFSRPTNLESFGFEIDTDVKVSTGQYKFMPSSNTINTLRPFAEQLSGSKTLLFKAIFRNESDESNVIYEASSEQYAAAGLNRVTNAGMAVRLDWEYVGGGLAAASLFMI